jgi:hypothetical protein
MKLHIKYILGLLIVALIIYFLQINTLREGSLGSDADKLRRFLERGKDVMGMYVSVYR